MTPDARYLATISAAKAQVGGVYFTRFFSMYNERLMVGYVNSNPALLYVLYILIMYTCLSDVKVYAH